MIEKQASVTNVLKQPTDTGGYSFWYYHSQACMPVSMVNLATEVPHTDLVDDCVCAGCGGNIHEPAMKKRQAMMSMRILLKNPTEEACQAFEAVLTNPHYYSDADEDGDVCYTIFDVSESKIQDWMKQAKAQGIVEDVQLLGESTTVTLIGGVDSAE